MTETTELDQLFIERHELYGKEFQAVYDSILMDIDFHRKKLEHFNKRLENINALINNQNKIAQAKATTPASSPKQ